MTDVITGAPLTEQDTVESFTFGIAQALPVGLEYNAECPPRIVL